MTPNLDRLFRWWEHLRPGDPFTLIDARRQMQNGFDGRTPLAGEKFTKWYATNSDPCIFEIVFVHPERDGTRVYECRFVGFQPPIDRRLPPGESRPIDPRPRRPPLSGGDQASVVREKVMAL